MSLKIETSKPEGEEHVAVSCNTILSLGMAMIADIQDANTEDDLENALDHFADVYLAAKSCEMMMKQRTGSVDYELAEDMQEAAEKKMQEVRGKRASWAYNMPDTEKKKMWQKEIDDHREKARKLEEQMNRLSYVSENFKKFRSAVSKCGSGKKC